MGNPLDDAVLALNAAVKQDSDEVELAMGRVKGYLRRLKNGKVVQVKGHDREFEKGSPEDLRAQASHILKYEDGSGTAAKMAVRLERLAQEAAALRAVEELGDFTRAPETREEKFARRAENAKSTPAMIEELRAEFRRLSDRLDLVDTDSPEFNEIREQRAEIRRRIRDKRLRLSSVEDAEDALMLELAGLIDVKSYFRRSKSGKTVNVKSYKRKVKGSDLKTGDIVKDAFGKQKVVSGVQTTGAESKVYFTDGTTGRGNQSFEKQESPVRSERDTLIDEMLAIENAGYPNPQQQKRIAEIENRVQEIDAAASRATQGSKATGYDAARLKAAGNPGATGVKIPQVEASPDAKVPPLSDEEYAQHTKHIEEQIGAALAAGKATDKQFAVDANSGVWEFERAQRHREIADAMWKARAESVPNEGKAMISGGLGGAGKSTVLKTLPGDVQSQYFTINSDDVKDHIAENFPDMIPEAGDLSPLERVALIHEESSHIADLLAARAYREKKNMIWDITMASQKSVQKRISDLRANGYTDVQGVFVNIDVETSVERALARHRRGMEDHRNGKGQGGRYVPPHIIRLNKSDRSSSANLDTFTALRDQFDSWHQYNNNVTGRAPVKEDSGSKTEGFDSTAVDPFVNRATV